MPQYRYKARSSRGDLMEGVLEADSPDGIASQLSNSGITPIEIVIAPAAGQTLTSEVRWFEQRTVTLDDLILFSRQLYSLVKAGVPIIRGLKGVLEATRSRPMEVALDDVVASLESGHNLSGSLGRHPKIFSSIIVAMVRVGENSGRLEEALMRISSYLELEKDTRDRIKAALRYPSFVIVAIAVALIIINIWVIPTFAKLFQGAHVELPWATRVIIATSDFFVAYWPLLLVLLAGLVIGVKVYVGTEEGRFRWHKWKLRLPIAGDIINRATLARFARGFAMSLHSGVPLIQALTVVSQAVDNDYLAEHIQHMRTGIERGDTLTRTMAATGRFTPLVLQMVGVGEETGQVDDMLDEVAGFYEREVDYDVKYLSAAIEPILIVAIGVMVLILALGVFLPMWDIIKVARGG